MEALTTVAVGGADPDMLSIRLVKLVLPPSAMALNEVVLRDEEAPFECVRPDRIGDTATGMRISGTRRLCLANSIVR